MRDNVGVIGRWVTLVGVVLQAGEVAATVVGQAGRAAAAGGLVGTGGLARNIFLAGLTLTLLGLVLVMGSIVVRRVEAGPRGALRAGAAVVVAAVLILAGGSFAYALQNNRAGAAPSDGSVHFKNAQLEALEGGFHQADHAEVPITYAQLQKVTAMLDTMRRASAPYRDVKAALAAGYTQITQDIPMLGAHFVNASIVAQQTFDPSQPPILLYEKVHGHWNLVGVSYLLPRTGASADQPTVIPGPLAVWHDHQNLCVTRNLEISVLGEKACVARNAYWLKDTGWMVHVWLWKDSPQGVFSHVNSKVG